MNRRYFKGKAFLAKMAVNQAGVDAGLEPVFPHWLERLALERPDFPKRRAYYDALRGRYPSADEHILHLTRRWASRVEVPIWDDNNPPGVIARMALKRFAHDLKRELDDPGQFARVCEALCIGIVPWG